MEVSGQLHAPVALPPGKSPWYHLGRRLGEPQSLSGHSDGFSDAIPGVRVPIGAGNFFFATSSRTALGPTHSPIQWVPGALSLGVKPRGVKLTTHLHLVPRSNNAWSYTYTPPLRVHVFTFYFNKEGLLTF
jgi:hypothetical protein